MGIIRQTGLIVTLGENVIQTSSKISGIHRSVKTKNKKKKKHLLFLRCLIPLRRATFKENLKRDYLFMSITEEIRLLTESFCVS